jgi:hypothetical protein
MVVSPDDHCPGVTQKRGLILVKNCSIGTQVCELTGPARRFAYDRSEVVGAATLPKIDVFVAVTKAFV